MSRSLILQNLYKSLNHILKNQCIILMITISCADNSKNNVSRINTFVTGQEVRDMVVFAPENEEKTQEEKNTLFVEGLKLLGATDHQIRSALVVFNSPECVAKDTCISLIREALLKTARYQDFTKRLILEVSPGKKIQIQRKHIPITQELRQIYGQIFNNQNNLELIRYRADLYLKFMDRALEENGKINPDFSVPEMAVAFEKIEKEFLLLKQAINVNPEGIKNFIRKFGFNETQDIQIILNQFKENIILVDQYYNIILLKVKNKGWDGLEYYNLMNFYLTFYAVLNFSVLDQGFKHVESQKSWFECTESVKESWLKLKTNRAFYESVKDLDDLIQKGHIGVISHDELSEPDIFVTHAFVPIFNMVAPGYFMMSYDGITRYTNEFNAHDFSHSAANMDIIGQIFIQGGTKEKMLQAIQQEIHRRLINANHLESFKQRFTQGDRAIIDILLFDHFHEKNMYSFLEDHRALGYILQSFIEGNSLIMDMLERYPLTSEQVRGLQLKLTEFIKTKPRILSQNIEEISYFFAEYSR